MNITVIGCGRWGSFIAWYLDRTGHTVTLYGRKSSSHIKQFIETRSNGLLTLPESIQLTTDLDAVDKADVIVISIAAQSLDSLMTQLQTMKLQNKIFVLCMKGIEIGTGRRLSQIASAHLDVSNKVAVWIGPGHVQEFYNGIPNCMVIDSEDEQVKKQLLEAFSSDLIRFYYGQDMIGNEIGAAAKNVKSGECGTCDMLFLRGVAPPARGAGGIPTSPLCPPGPPIPPSNGRGIPPDPPCTATGTSPCLSTDRVRIGHAIWFGLGPATNRVPGRGRTLHGSGAGARTAARRHYCRNTLP